MHRVILDAPMNMLVDHINGNGLDNRRENLRICTNTENLRNRGKDRDNTSGYKGVVIKKGEKKFRAQIRVNQKTIHLGSFSTPEEAARAYDDAAREYFGEFAWTNF